MTRCFLLAFHHMPHKFSCSQTGLLEENRAAGQSQQPHLQKYPVEVACDHPKIQIKKGRKKITKNILLFLKMKSHDFTITISVLQFQSSISFVILL